MIVHTPAPLKSGICSVLLGDSSTVVHFSSVWRTQMVEELLQPHNFILCPICIVLMKLSPKQWQRVASAAGPLAWVQPELLLQPGLLVEGPPLELLQPREMAATQQVDQPRPRGWVGRKRNPITSFQFSLLFDIKTCKSYQEIAKKTYRPCRDLVGGWVGSWRNHNRDFSSNTKSVSFCHALKARNDSAGKRPQS